jgi:hypothetical protein
MSYPDAVWERAMTVQQVLLQALSGEIHWYRAADRRCQVVRAIRRQALKARNRHGRAFRPRPHAASANAVVSATMSHSRQRRRITAR